MEKLDSIVAPYLKKIQPLFDIGDTVDVHVKVVEGEKERIQIFTGVVIKKKGRGVKEAFTVRRLVGGEGVERIFPMNAPSVVNVMVKKKGRVRRAKLYYLRGRVGKATKIKEIIGDSGHEEAGKAAAAATAAAAALVPVTAGAPAPATAAAPAK